MKGFTFLVGLALLTAASTVLAAPSARTLAEPPPPVVGLSYADARQLLTGWRSTVVIRVLPNGVPDGADATRITVDAQHINLGEERSPAPTVFLTLVTQMPSVEGMTLDEARAALLPLGIGILGVPLEADGGWTVTKQAPPAGTTVRIDNYRPPSPVSPGPTSGGTGDGGGTFDGVAGPPGARVTLQVADLVAVPDLDGMSESDARAAVDDAGLAFTLRLTRDGDLPGRVVGQDPPAGTRAPRGSSVTAAVQRNSSTVDHGGPAVGESAAETQPVVTASVLRGVVGAALLMVLLLLVVVLVAVARRSARNRRTRPAQVTTRVRFPAAELSLRAVGTGADHIVSVRLSHQPTPPILEELPR